MLLPVDPTASIRRLGFRKWYERELIKCHAALVTCLLCGLTMAALLETIDFADFGWSPASKLAIIVAAGALAWVSWKTYIRILTRAEFSTGLDEDPGRVAEAVAPLPAAWLRVQCRQCGTAWRMPE
jgi:hypothetical protein